MRIPSPSQLLKWTSVLLSLVEILLTARLELGAPLSSAPSHLCRCRSALLARAVHQFIALARVRHLDIRMPTERDAYSLNIYVTPIIHVLSSAPPSRSSSHLACFPSNCSYSGYQLPLHRSLLVPPTLRWFLLTRSLGASRSCWSSNHRVTGSQRGLSRSARPVAGRSIIVEDVARCS